MSTYAQEQSIKSRFMTNANCFLQTDNQKNLKEGIIKTKHIFSNTKSLATCGRQWTLGHLPCLNHNSNASQAYEPPLKRQRTISITQSTRNHIYCGQEY